MVWRKVVTFVHLSLLNIGMSTTSTSHVKQCVANVFGTTKCNISVLYMCISVHWHTEKANKPHWIDITGEMSCCDFQYLSHQYYKKQHCRYECGTNLIMNNLCGTASPRHIAEAAVRRTTNEDSSGSSTYITSATVPAQWGEAICRREQHGLRASIATSDRLTQ